MKDIDPINNMLFYKLIQNSIFTPRQIQIIYNFKNNDKRIQDISSGAYYREVKQSKIKLKKICYSIMLLDLLNIMGSDQIIVLNPVISQLRILSEGYDNYHKNNINKVVGVIDEMVNRAINM